MAFLGGGRAIGVFLCFAGAYLLSYAFRAINAVIAPALLADVGLTNSDLGLLSSAYFVAFGSLQLPLGIWLDKYGARKTESALLMFAAAGAAIFAMSTSLVGLWIGRALIGVGVSACLMASLKAYRSWYAPEQQSQLASWMLVVGSAGALTATVPVTAAMPWIGWRGVFWIMCGLILLAAAAIFFLLKKVETSMAAAPPAASIQQNRGNDSNNGYAFIFANPYFRRLALLGFVNHGTFLALQTLWAGPWMTTVLGMSKEQSAQILFVFNFALMLGYLGLGWWAPRYVSQDGLRRWSVTQTVTVGIFCTLVLQAMIIGITAPWAWMLWIVLGLFTTVTTLTQSYVGLAFPSSLAGRANSAYNLSLFMGAFLVQWGIGVLIDVFTSRGISPAGAMQATFGVCLSLQALAWAAFAMNRAQAQTVAA
jgi:MFS family permease